MTDHPITPPHDQVYWWWEEACKRPPSSFYEKLDYVAAKATEWGADQELGACCEWVSQWRCMVGGSRPEVCLRAARRPEPKGLAEEALTAFYRQTGGALTPESQVDAETIRRALERLQELEGQSNG